MRKVVTELNGMLPPQASTTPGQGTGTSFVLFSAIHEPDGLCDHELVVHDCVGGVDNSAQRVLERMRNAWLSDWLLSVTDFISGMTDTYALSQFQRLRGLQ